MRTVSAEIHVKSHCPHSKQSPSVSKQETQADQSQLLLSPHVISVAAIALMPTLPPELQQPAIIQFILNLQSPARQQAWLKNIVSLSPY